MVLFGIAKNVLRNHDRSALRSASLLGGLQFERNHERHNDESPIHEALSQLGPDDREVLLLTYWDRFSNLKRLFLWEHPRAQQPHRGHQRTTLT